MVLVGLVVAAVALTAFWVATGVLIARRDVPVGPGEWGVVRNTALRGTVLVALAGLLGYSLTMLLRSTVATLGIGLGVAAAGSLGLVAVFGEGALRWLVPTNALAVLNNGYEFYVWSPSCNVTIEGEPNPCLRTVSLEAGVVYLVVVLVVVVAASLMSFRRRDLP